MASAFFRSFYSQYIRGNTHSKNLFIEQNQVAINHWFEAGRLAVYFVLPASFMYFLSNPENRMLSSITPIIYYEPQDPLVYEIRKRKERGRRRTQQSPQQYQDGGDSEGYMRSTIKSQPLVESSVESPDE